MFLTLQDLMAVEDLEYQAILKIDHHPSEDIIGDVDWTDDTKSSTCEMIANLIMDTKACNGSKNC